MIQKTDLAHTHQIDAFYDQHMQSDFGHAALTRDNFASLLDQGLLAVFTYTQDCTEKGYVICLEKDEYVIILFFAAYPAFRGQGVGTRFLRELGEYYRHSKQIVAEVETLDNAADEKEAAIITRRIAFYERNGFVLLGGIKEWLDGQAYHIMIFPLRQSFDQSDTREIAALMTSIYSQHIKGKTIRFDLT